MKEFIKNLVILFIIVTILLSFGFKGLTLKLTSLVIFIIIAFIESDIKKIINNKKLKS